MNSHSSSFFFASFICRSVLLTYIILDNKEEHMQQKKEEEEVLKEVTAHFQITLTETQAQLEQHEIHNAKLQQENMEMGEKLKKLTDQYALREEVNGVWFVYRQLLTSSKSYTLP
uniref:CYorf15B protein n=1 Tax=Homo sapiens TaxID=9606 RepID=Q8N4A2_HUMAN